MHMDDLGGYIMSNQQGKMLIQNLNRIVRRPNVMPWQIPHCTTDCIPIILVFQENFPANTQVRNSLCCQNDRRERGVISVTNGCYNSNPNKVRNISHQEVKYSTMWMGQADNQLITTGHSHEVKGCNTMTISLYRTQPLLMMAIQITHKQE